MLRYHLLFAGNFKVSFLPPDFLGERGKTQTRISEGFSNYRIRGMPPPTAIQTYSMQITLPKAQF